MEKVVMQVEIQILAMLFAWMVGTVLADISSRRRSLKDRVAKLERQLEDVKSELAYLRRQRVA